MQILEEMPKDSTSIQADNVINRYSRRPKALDMCCFADFVARFRIILPVRSSERKIKEKGQAYLPEVVYDDVIEEDCQSDEEDSSINTKERQVEETLPDLATKENIFDEEYHMKDGSVLRPRKKPRIIRTVRYNKDTDPENFFREQLMLYLPWRDENVDLIGSFQTYEDSYKYHYNDIQKSCKGYESESADLLDDIQDNDFSDDHVVAPEIQHTEMCDEAESALKECFNPVNTEREYDLATDLGISRKQACCDEYFVNEISNEKYMQMVRALNPTQRVFFNHVLHWIKTEDQPMHYFLSGGAGVGKSVVTTVLYQAITRYFAKQMSSSPDEVQAVLCAPTGKAAHHIGGSTIHSLFCIPANQGFKYKPLDPQQLDSLRVKFRSLKVIFIDEISMVGKSMFNYINLRLQEIFSNSSIFGGKSIIAIGDLYQLKPVMDGWIFSDSKSVYGPLATNIWQDNFHLYELTVIMRQKDDQHFAQILNRLREGLHTSSDLEHLKQRVQKSKTFDNEIHLFTKNAEVNAHNLQAYNTVASHKKCSIAAIDTAGGEGSASSKKYILQHIPDDTSKTMGLSSVLCLAEDLPAEICINVDVEDGLTNGTPCMVKKLDYRVHGSNRCSIIWVLFCEDKTGAKARTRYAFLRKTGISNSWTPILEISRKFKVGRIESCYVTRRQFPLKLAASKTIHKSQGSTMDTAVLHFGDKKNEHMHYVGLSRVQKLENVHILHLNEEKIAVSHAVAQEMDRMRKYATISPCFPLLENITTDLKIVYHNSRSLHLHIEDLRADTNIQAADIIVIAETRLQEQDPSEIYSLQDFHMHRFDSSRHDNGRPYRGIVMYTKIQIDGLVSFTLHGIETVSCSIVHEGEDVQLVFLYTSPKSSSISNFLSFINELQDILDMSKPFIIMGDTNIDFFNQTLLTQYLQRREISQLMHIVTTDYQTCLDHVYVKGLSHMQTTVACLESHYSDHKPIVLYLPFLHV